MPLRSADWVVVGVAAALVGAATVLTWIPATAAQFVEIRGPDGTETYPIAEDRRVHVVGFIGASEIELASGRVRFVDAPCRNRVCIAAGWLSTGGDFAACAPNGVSILLRADDERYDAINY